MPIKNNKKKGSEDKKIFKSAKTAKKGGEGEQPLYTVNKLINISSDKTKIIEYLQKDPKKLEKLEKLENFNICVRRLTNDQCCSLDEFRQLSQCQTPGGKSKPKPKSKVPKKK